MNEQRTICEPTHKNPKSPDFILGIASDIRRSNRLEEMSDQEEYSDSHRVDIEREAEACNREYAPRRTEP